MMMSESDQRDSWHRNRGVDERKEGTGLKDRIVNLILENFQSAFNKRFNQSFIDDIKSHPSSLLWRYFLLDFAICNFLVAPSVIAFWRGTWDYSIVYLENIEYLKVGSMNYLYWLWRRLRDPSESGLS